jgi:hypothetical protein
MGTDLHHVAWPLRTDRLTIRPATPEDLAAPMSKYSVTMVPRPWIV